MCKERQTTTLLWLLVVHRGDEPYSMWKHCSLRSEWDLGQFSSSCDISRDSSGSSYIRPHVQQWNNGDQIDSLDVQREITLLFLPSDYSVRLDVLGETHLRTHTHTHSARMARVGKARVKDGVFRLSWHCAVRPSWPARKGAPTTCSWKTWDFAVLARRKAVADSPNWWRPVRADRPCTRSAYRSFANGELTTVTTIVKDCSAMSPTAMQYDLKHASAL